MSIEEIKQEIALSLLCGSYHTYFPNPLFDYWVPRLKATESMILFFLWYKISNRCVGSEIVSISSKQFIQQTGLSRNTIKDSLHSLESFGLITIIREENAKEGNLSNKFTFTDKNMVAIFKEGV